MSEPQSRRVAKAPKAAGDARRTTREDRGPRWYQGKMWSGMGVKAWTRLLARNRFSVDPSRLLPSVAITLFAVANTALGAVQRLVFGRRLAAVSLPDDPIFIVGHWRSGTTMLHELLALDPRHSAPTTYQSLSPLHCLLTDRLASSLRFLLPAKRPMDNMQLDWDRPQEDEVALCCLGLPSPFLTVAFPNRPLQDPGYVTLEGLPEAERSDWVRVWRGFLRQVLFRKPGVLVLKSPQHSFRLKLIEGVFPRARYVHVVRDPYDVFPSTVHFWKSMYRAHGLQEPTFDKLDDLVFDTFDLMDRKIDEGRETIDPARWHDLSYEDLVQDPIGELKRLYDALDLDDFEPAATFVKRWLDEQATYKKNAFALTEEIRQEIGRRWSSQIERHRHLRRSS